MGPFKTITQNFRHGIDGSFWIDDDDRLIFLYLETSTIKDTDKDTELDLSTMIPTGKKTSLNASLKGWTEEPGIFRRGDYHYLTYTGNHVVSTGYRVAYSYIKGEDPLGQYIMSEDNILLTRTK